MSSKQNIMEHGNKRKRKIIQRMNEEKRLTAMAVIDELIRLKSQTIETIIRLEELGWNKTARQLENKVIFHINHQQMIIEKVYKI